MFENDALKRGIPEPFYRSASTHVQARTRELHSKPSARAQDYHILLISFPEPPLYQSAASWSEGSSN